MKRSERTFFGRVLHDKKSNTLPTGIRFLKNHQHIVGIAVLLQIFAISAIFNYLGPSQASAASLTLTIPSSFSLDITPGAGGVFSKSSGQTINVKTDNDSGYTLSIKAKNSDNSNSLLNGSNKLSSISEQTTENNFKSDSKFNNTWGYLPSKFNNKDNTSFLPGPTTEESILETTEEANNETGTDYNITLGAKVDNAVSSGNYNNAFIFSATANAPKYDAIMQDWKGCGNLSEEQTIKLLDIRDDNVYTVAKLKDGKCWMTQNLRLGDSKFTKKNPERKLTPQDTDILSDWVVSYDGGFSIIPDNYGENELAKYGAYYGPLSATAETGSTHNNDVHDASGSICPKGWRLPNANSSGDFDGLLQAYGSGIDGYDNLKEGTVPNFILSGYSAGDITERGTYGYWSSSNFIKGDNSENIPLLLYLRIGSDGSIDLPYKKSNPFFSYSVRCIVREPKKITDLQYFQDWNGLSEADKTDVINSMQDETNYTLKDKRDDNEYTIAKLKDGKVWMTQNLRLIDKEITPTDSDMTSGSYTIPSSTNSGWNRYVYANKVYYDNDTNYGALYTWLTATAGTGEGTISFSEAPSSICPKGWRLPTRAEMNTLTSTYSVSQAQTSPPNFGSSSWAGLCNQDGCPANQGSRGFWWSSTGYSGAYAYSLFSKSGGFTTNYEYLGNGFSVRCVGRE